MNTFVKGEASLLLQEYAREAGADVIDRLQQLTYRLRDLKVVHVNSTKEGGGVAEILTKMVPLMRELGLDTQWEVITGDDDFFQCTKGMHNALQGSRIEIPERLFRAYEETNRRNYEKLGPLLEEADVVFIHDPQPAPLLSLCPNRKGIWIWRCHIDLSRPYRPVWKRLQPFVENFDASVFSLSSFARTLSHPQYLIPPSIDPLADKNVELPPEEVREVYERFDLDPDRPILVQISRFDRFKDPVGVIQAYRIARRSLKKLQLVLAGGGASDDPEGAVVLDEVRQFADGDPDIHILELPPEANRTINALQRVADVVLQKSLKEGFGLTVTEAMWKSRPVIGGDVGGIRLQVINSHTGYLVSTPEGAALRIRYLIERPWLLKRMGEKAKEFVRENFLLTRQLQEYLTMMVALVHKAGDRIELA